MEVTQRKRQQSAEVIQLPVERDSSTKAVLHLIRERVFDRSDFLLSGLKVNSADALFEEMKNIQQQDALAYHFNIMRAMKVGEEVYTGKFNQLLNHAWDTFPEGMDDSHIAMPTGEVARWIKTQSNKAQNHYKVLLRDVRLRLQTLLDRPVEEHPLMPQLYYRSFWQALTKLDLSYDERRFMLALFHRFVMDRYGQIVGDVNRTMIELKIDLTQFPTSSQ